MRPCAWGASARRATPSIRSLRCATIRHPKFQTGDCPMVRFLAFIGFLGIVIAVVAAVYFFGGFYSVAATAEEPDIIKSMLVQVRQASIARHAKGLSEPPASDEAVRAGARAFSTRGCENCHGAPGVDWGKWSEGMRPDPPDLKEVAQERTRSELFWVVK